jgi:hypothetical protein
MAKPQAGAGSWCAAWKPLLSESYERVAKNWLKTSADQHLAGTPIREYTSPYRGLPKPILIEAVLAIRRHLCLIDKGRARW